MRHGSDTYRFGPFALDPRHRRLHRHGEPIRLHGRQMDVLLILAAQAGQLVSKEALVAGAWRDAAVTDSAIVQAVSRLRTALGDQPDGTPYIETQSREGYRFVAPLEREAPSPSPLALDPLLAPYRAFVDGRAGLERLDRGAIDRARLAFVEGVRAVPDDAAAHIGLANACVLRFETTRADVEPDVEALRQADHHAREGCRLNPTSGDAWSTWGLVRHRLGDTRDATAAALKAVSLDPDNWHHCVRLALVSWGGRRLSAAHRARALYPDLALAHWLSATVFVARQAFDIAQAELRAGCARLDTQDGTGPVRAVGLHLLHGLVLAATGDLDAGLQALSREIGSAGDDHVYGRESCANAWYATGALHLRSGRRAQAAVAFREALTRVPGHALASVGLASIDPAVGVSPARLHANPVDPAIVEAARLALHGHHDDAARLCERALSDTDHEMAGWQLPVEPILNVSAHAEAWKPALALVRRRAG